MFLLNWLISLKLRTGLGCLPLRPVDRMLAPLAGDAKRTRNIRWASARVAQQCGMLFLPGAPPNEGILRLNFTGDKYLSLPQGELVSDAIFLEGALEWFDEGS